MLARGPEECAALGLGSCCGVLDGKPYCCPVEGSSYGGAAGPAAASCLFAHRATVHTPQVHDMYTPAAFSSLARHVWSG